MQKVQMHVHSPRSDEDVVTLPSHVFSYRCYHSHFHHHFLSGTLLPPIWREFEFLTHGHIIWADFVVLYSFLRGLSTGTLVFPSHGKPTLILIWYVVIQFDLQSPQFIKPMCSAKSIETSISYYCYRYYYYYYYYYHYYYYYYIIIRGVFVINSTSNSSFICLSLRYNYWKA